MFKPRTYLLKLAQTSLFASGVALSGLAISALPNAVCDVRSKSLVKCEYMGVGTGGAEGAAAPPTFGTGEQAIALAPPKSNNCKQRVRVINC